jgi:hypothetical protein
LGGRDVPGWKGVKSVDISVIRSVVSGINIGAMLSESIGIPCNIIGVVSFGDNGLSVTGNISLIIGAGDDTWDDDTCDDDTWDDVV